MAGMSEFRGFSDREIKTLQEQKQQKKQERRPESLKNADFPRPRPPPSEIARGKKIENGVTSPPGNTALPTTAYFVKQAQTQSLTAKSGSTTPNETNGGSDERGKDKNDDAKDNSPSVSTATEECIAESNFPDLQMDSQAALQTNLELLQRQQKELEQENEKKKALLEQTLQERYARSQMEAKKLQAVKEELARLDSLLNRDVAILRAKIEGADRQYTVTRKRYETAEAEFVAAKLALHKVSEAKELLSEHLCTIIQQNELRKSEKLAELLQTLELETQSNGDATTKSVSGNAMFHKTPTPGINIWPRDRLMTQSHKNDTDIPQTITGDDDDVTVNNNSQEKLEPRSLESPAPPDSSSPTGDESTTQKITENSGHDKNSTPLILF